MRLIKIILLSLTLLSILVMLFSLLIPANVKLSRAITINKPAALVKETLTNLPTWNNWNTGAAKKMTKDSNLYNAMDKILTLKDFTVKVLGTTDSTIQYVMKNEAGQLLYSNVWLLNHNDSCTVNWSFDFKSKWYPWEKFRNIFVDNMYGPGLDSNLTALKKYIEKQP